MKLFIAGMVTMVIVLTAVMYVLNIQNDKLKTENDRLNSQQQTYNANTIQAHTSLDALLEQ